MRKRLLGLITVATISSLLLLCSGGGSAADGGADAGVACVDYAGKPCVPVACDGGLCDTSNGSACSVAGRLRRRRSDSPTLVLTVLGSVALVIARRRGRHAAERFR
jgi:hypothetical protein